MRAGSVATHRSVAAALVSAMRQLHADRLVTGTVGNASGRSGQEVLITPTRTRYDELWPEEIVRIGSHGQPAEDGAAPSMELALHLAIYEARGDVGAVVHTHSVQATAWSFLGIPLEPDTEETAYYDIGPVRTARPAPRASEQLGRAAVEALGDSRAALLGRHGVVAVGPTVADAVDVAYAVEHQATIAWLLRNRT